MSVFAGLFRTARTEGLGVTLHIAEVRTFLLRPGAEIPPRPPSKGMLKEIFGTEQTRGNSTAETKELLSCEPERLGHATYLDDEAREVVMARRTCIEICLTSNLLCVLSLLRSSFSSERGHRVLADAKRCSNSRITTSSITLLGTTPSPSVYVFSYSCTLTSPFNSQVRSVLTHLTDR